MSSRYVREIERGTPNIRVATLGAIADAFGVEPGVLMRKAEMHAARGPGRPRGVKERRPRIRV